MFDDLILKVLLNIKKLFLLVFLAKRLWVLCFEKGVFSMELLNLYNRFLHEVNVITNFNYSTVSI